MIHKRKLFVLASLNNKLFAIGGYSETGKLLKSVEAYDVYHNKWQMMAPMNKTRCSHGFAIHNNCIYVIGGNDEETIEFYEPIINKWFMVNKSCSCTIFGFHLEYTILNDSYLRDSVDIKLTISIH